MSIKPKKRFEQMTVPELKTVKGSIEQQIATVTQEIEKVSRETNAAGRSCSITDFPQLESSRVNLCWMLSKINKELKVRWDAQPQHSTTSPAPSSQAMEFQKVAKMLLEPSLYQHLLDQVGVL